MRDNRLRRLVRPGEPTRLALHDLVRLLVGDRGATEQPGRHGYASRMAAFGGRHPLSLAGLRSVVIALGSVVVATTLFNASAGAQSVRTARVSALADGTGGNGASSDPATASGAPGITAFTSTASNLAAADPSSDPDVYLNDNGTITVLSAAAGVPSPAGEPSISADGRFVAFTAGLRAIDGSSRIFVWDKDAGVATELSTSGSTLDQHQPAISPDGGYVAFAARTSLDGPLQVYLAARTGGSPTLVSRVPVDADPATDDDGDPGDFDSTEPDLSAGAGAVAFSTEATNLFRRAGDTNGVADIVVAQGVLAGTPTLAKASVGPGGSPADGPSFGPALTADGAKVVFQSFATNLVSGDGNGTSDVFLRTLASQSTTLISQGGNGTPASGLSRQADISADGRYVAFASRAPDIVPNDTNNAVPPEGRTPTAFAVLNPSGQPTYAFAAQVGAEPNTVVAGFPVDAITAASAATVDEGAVTDGQQLPTAVRQRRSNANPVATLGITPAPAGGLTAGPDLVSATLSGTVVTYCFDEDVTVATQNAPLFGVSGYDSAVMRAASSVASAGATCVAATFAAAGFPAQLTLAFVLAGAAQDSESVSNVAQSRALTQPTDPATAAGPGRTTAPDLVSAAAANANDVDFTFDEAVLDASTVLDRFGIVDAAGTETQPASKVSVTGAVVRMRFTAALPGAFRAFTDQGAVTDAAGEFSPTGNAAGATARPFVVAAAPDGVDPTTYIVQFSAPVQDFVPSLFEAYTEDATAFRGLTAEAGGADGTVVRVTFEPFVIASPRPTRIAAAASAVKAQGTLAASTPSAVPTAAPNGQASGRTDGPDLVAVDLTRGDGTVVYTFDEPVQDVHLARPQATGYGVACGAPCPPDGPADPADVFVRDTGAGRTVRASVDQAGNEGSGDSGQPSISAEGRFVALASDVALAAGDGGVPRDAFVRDLVDVAVSPGTLTFVDPEFQAARIGAAASSRATATVRNAGFGKLRFPAASSITGPNAAEFAIALDTCTGNVLDPEQVCQIDVDFRPAAVGSRSATLVINDDAVGSPHTVSLQGEASTPPTQPPSNTTFTQLPATTSTTGAPRGGGTATTSRSTSTTRTGTPSAGTTTTTITTGTTLPPVVPAFTPKVLLDPLIAEQGSVITVRGSGFPVLTDVRLSWSQGLGSATVRTDVTGGFTTPMLIFPNDVTGTRVLFARAPQTVGTAVLLVLPASQDPTFLIRKRANRA